jgi:hypothetical protein
MAIAARVRAAHGKEVMRAAARRAHRVAADELILMASRF